MQQASHTYIYRQNLRPRLRNATPFQTKGVNTVPDAVPVWPAVRYISDTGQYQCTISDLPLFFTILYDIQSYISNNSIYNIGNILNFFMELLTFTTTPYMISCEG